MDYKQLIKNWHTKTLDEDYFSKFVFEYLAFIAYLKTQLYKEPNLKDREAIQKLKVEEGKKEKYLKQIDSNEILKGDWEKIKEELDRWPLGNASRNSEIVVEIPWWNCSHEHPNQKTTADKNKPLGVLHSFQDWENMVEFWYSIRNNLFHATKNPENNRDKLVAEFGYKTLKEFMNILLKDLNQTPKTLIQPK